MPGGADGRSDTRDGQFLRDVMRLNDESRNFRIMGPDETASNRLDAVFEVTDRGLDGDDRALRRPSRARTAASWRSSASTSARAGSRAISSPAGTACSPATRPSSTSSIQCSTSMPNG